jgi:hypothetical protein
LKSCKPTRYSVGTDQVYASSCGDGVAASDLGVRQSHLRRVT